MGRYTGILIVFMVALVLGLNVHQAGADQYRMDTGDPRNLITVLNDHADRIEALNSKLLQLAAKLDDQNGSSDHETSIENLNSKIVELMVKLDADFSATGIHETAIEHLNSELVELAKKLDADGGVTGTDYESGLAAGVSAITSTDVIATMDTNYAAILAASPAPITSTDVVTAAFATDFEDETNNSDAPVTSTTTVHTARDH